MTGRTPVPEVIWARPERAGRGPRPAYSRAEIAAAGVRVADAEGLDAVSMRRVAAELGSGTMTLYNYVPRKEDLYELMVDAVSAEYDLPEHPAGEWRTELTALARASRALMHRHPWLPRLMSPVYGFSPNALRFLEYSLACLDALDAPHGAKLELVAMVTGLVTTYVANELATVERARVLPWSEEKEQEVRGRYLLSQVSTGRYPRLAASFAGDPGPVDLEEAFERAVRRTLNGFAVDFGAVEEKANP